LVTSRVMAALAWVAVTVVPPTSANTLSMPVSFAAVSPVLGIR